MDVLPKLVKGYNLARHRIIGRSPASVTEENAMDVWHHVYVENEEKRDDRKLLQVGDQVRLSKIKHPFEKGNMPKWTEEIFVIHAIERAHEPPLYTLQDWAGETIEGRFYREELQKVVKRDNIYRIERILRERGANRNKQYLVQWLGYPQPTWIRAPDIVERPR